MQASVQDSCDPAQTHGCMSIDDESSQMTISREWTKSILLDEGEDDFDETSAWQQQEL